jgi:uncharacterized membrane protein YdjX (TVP38/TMEM64 family)
MTAQRRAKSTPIRADGSRATRRGRGSWIVWVVVALVAGLALLLLGRQLGGYVVGFAEWVEGLGGWGPLAFILGYAVATVAFVPGSLLTLASGAVFGLLSGALYVLVGAVLGSSMAFLIARYLARGRVEQRIAADPRFSAIDQAIGREGRKIVFLLRLSPVFPYNLLNYALGVTRVRFVDYLIASLGMVPGIFLYVYTGRVVGDVAAIAAGVGLDRGTGDYLLLIAGFVATVLVTWYVTRLARRALRAVEK